MTGMTTPNSVASIFHNVVTAWIILILSLFITIISWHVSNHYVQKRADENFNYKVEEARLAIIKRMEEYQQVLRGGLGLFTAQRDLSRWQWKAYVETLDIDAFWPGIQGIGFSRMIAPEDKEAHEQQLRREGYPDYAIKPAGKREIYSAIIFLEPFDKRNQRAFGYDMFSDAVRRTAMEQARDTGRPTLSGMVTLVQETDRDIQPGFLIFLPLYREGASLNTIEERRVALEGFVYSPFRVKDLFRGILGHGDSYLDFQVYDGDTVTLPSLLYSTINAEGGGEVVQRIHHNQVRSIALPGRNWTVSFQSRPTFDHEMESSQPFLVACLGMMVDILLFLILKSISGQKDRIQKEAFRIGQELTASETHARHLAEEANRTKSEFLANMSHELRTPLNSLLILSKILADNRDENLTPKQVELARIIHQSGSDLLRLINDILDLSRVEAGRVVVVPTEKHIFDLVQYLDRMFTSEAVEKGIAFRVTTDAKLPATWCTDWNKVEQILSKILSNAFKFTERGFVTVTLGYPPSGHLFTNPRLGSEPCLAITVADSGIGISETQQGQIFKAFWQADSSTSRKYGGTGLGLSISRKFCELLGGEIRVESQEGCGTSVTLFLPAHVSATPIMPTETLRVLDAPDHDQTPAAAPRDDGTEHRVEKTSVSCVPEVCGDDPIAQKSVQEDVVFTVLIVNDDMRYSFSLAQFFQGRSIRVFFARDGQKALVELEKKRGIDILLVDVSLPNRDGLVAIYSIKGRDDFRHFPIIALVDADRPEDREMSLQAGADNTVGKPVEFPVLLETMQTWFASKSAGKESESAK
ncbi:MAG: CHASE domain-containing protein [Nitrospirae bacterium]|nr:CHASE domain-containing protein [Magnetococcales bacterium]